METSSNAPDQQITLWDALTAKDSRIKSLGGNKPTLVLIGRLMFFAGALIVLYGVGYGIFKNRQYAPVHAERTSSWMQGLADLDAMVQNEQRRGVRSDMTERAVHIAMAGGLILIVGGGLVFSVVKVP